MGLALGEFKAGAFLQSQNRNRKAQKWSSEEARPGARALVSFPKVMMDQEGRKPGMPPCANASTLPWDHHTQYENWGFGYSIVLHPHSQKK